ncbi:MAG: ABC superfamily ATP binding cassette transporter, extracellular solute-binding protein [Actinomyces urogenitalis DORA_12]|uniref:ABC superfamily ATP binding cassette transporter, extracellular solute-binding protein n=1 Tax=Actinomyces urogenitalis DORA_12 TaxID=1403939 RepID=W1VNS6_9ACTO|nr:MAG: ABC superfamily ATP binding cassette transporter, extracellular solute-binding protein [Actinomyces urogenitalis DORA_12]
MSFLPSLRPGASASRLSRRTVLRGGALTALALTLAACSGKKTDADYRVEEISASAGLNDPGTLPIVTSPVTVTATGSRGALSVPYDQMKLPQQWAADTGIEVSRSMLTEDVYAEKKNLLLASGDLPDILWNTGLSDAEVATYSSNHTLVPLDELMEGNCPNILALFEARPDICSAVTSDDGHIYTLPSVEELGLVQFPNFLYINTDWLAKVDRQMPTTIEELHEVLLAFKKEDPSGSGRPIPLSFVPGSFCANPWDLVAAYGGQADNNDHRIVIDRKAVFTAASDAWKEGVRQLAAWYQEGLIDSESFSQDDTAYLAKGKADTESLGAFYWWEATEFVGADREGHYALCPVLKGVDGQARASVSNNQEISRGAFAMTRTCRYQTAVMRWVDRMYDPVMSAQNNWGPIGVTLEYNSDGLLDQIPAAEGESAGERRQKVAPGGPKAITEEDFRTVVLPEPRAALRQQQVTEVYRGHAANDAFPPVVFTNAELDDLSLIEADVTSLVKQRFARWVVDGGIDKEWEDYLEDLRSSGLERLMEIYQAALDRYYEQLDARS